MAIHLFKQFSELKEKISYINLGQYPTPVHRLKKIAEEFSFNSLWIKRDDLSGEIYGGNKVRKLEFLLADARSKRKKHLIAVGAAGSNYVTATGIYGKREGFSLSAVLFHQPPTDYLKSNLLVNQFNGVELNISSSMLTVPLTEIAVILRHGLKNTYITPPGGSSALSTLGYVNAILELKEQIDTGLLPEPDYIFVPLGTGGTMAGLVLGCKLTGIKAKVVGIRVVDRIVSNSYAVLRLANGALKIMKNCGVVFDFLKVNRQDFIILHEYFGKGYAHYTESGSKSVRIMQELEGIKLEGTYTGKTFAGMIDFVKNNNLGSKNILFWNTYNSRDISQFSEPINYRTLPAAFHKYFTLI